MSTQQIRYNTELEFTGTMREVDFCVNYIMSLTNKKISKVPRVAKVSKGVKNAIKNNRKAQNLRRSIEDDYISYNPLLKMIPVSESQYEDACIENNRHQVAHYLQTNN